MKKIRNYHIFFILKYELIYKFIFFESNFKNTKSYYMLQEIIVIFILISLDKKFNQKYNHNFSNN